MQDRRGNEIVAQIPYICLNALYNSTKDEIGR